MSKPVLSFSQTQGLAPLPQPLKLGELPSLTRVKIEAAFQRSLRESVQSSYHSVWVSEPWKTIGEDIQIEFLGVSFSQAQVDATDIANVIEAYILKRPYNLTFDFILFVLRHVKCPGSLVRLLKGIFEKDMLAYRLISDPISIIPVSSPEEADTILRAIEATSTDHFSGARAHLLAASSEINSANFHNAVRESIHAVESVARVLDGRSDKELGPALAALEKKVSLHGAFKKGISALYGYSSNEQGIRHALLDDDIKPDLHDALFMFGACAAFVTFMIGKARSAGILEGP